MFQKVSVESVAISDFFCLSSCQNCMILFSTKLLDAYVKYACIVKVKYWINSSCGSCSVQESTNFPYTKAI